MYSILLMMSVFETKVLKGRGKSWREYNCIILVAPHELGVVPKVQLDLRSRKLGQLVEADTDANRPHPRGHGLLGVLHRRQAVVATRNCFKKPRYQCTKYVRTQPEFV